MDVKETDNCIQVVFSYYELEMLQEHREEYIQRRVEFAKHELAIKVFDTVFNLGHPVVLDTHLERFDDPYTLHVVYRFHYRLTAVQNRHVVVPVFTFTNHLGKVEWKCSYCATINSIDATFCGEKHHNAVGCGHPRDKVRQDYEMYS